jgi:hypothetical protein
VTFLADLGQALTILDAPDADRVRLIADGSALQDCSPSGTGASGGAWAGTSPPSGASSSCSARRSSAR